MVSKPLCQRAGTPRDSAHGDEDRVLDPAIPPAGCEPLHREGWDDAIFILGIPRHIGADPPENLPGFYKRVGLPLDDFGNLPADRGSKGDVRETLAQKGTLPAEGDGLHFTFDEIRMVGEGGVFEDLLELEGFGRIGDPCLEVNAPLSCGAPGICARAIRCDQMRFRGCAKEVDLPLLMVVLWEREPDPDDGTGLQAGSVRRDGQGVGDLVVNG